MTEASAASPRYPLFDGLRALAVLAVAYSHWIPPHWHFGVPWGKLGVQLFFVLSGFLITTILLRERARIAEPSLAARWHLVRAFVARRALRIFPIYWLTLLLCLFAGVAEVRADFWWHFFYASNILAALRQEWFGPLSHVWTLAVEEQFYLVWPLLIVFASVAVRSRVIVALIVLCAVTSMVFGLLGGTARDFLSLLPVPAFLGIATGALMAVYWERGNRLAGSRARRVLLGSGLFLATILVLSARSHPVSWLPGMLLGIAIIAFVASVIAWAAQESSGPVARILTLRPVVYLGTISYGFYLYHNFAPMLIGALVQVDVLPRSIDYGYSAPIVRFVLTLALAALSWHFIERPLNRLKDRISYGPSSSAAPAPIQPVGRASG